ncbi:hypothetical protein HN859_01345 [Candidatus Parcubacteria bacterium]|jgi:hypothetical protein|nr:hypothetical protein [Candidatus Parcubacteria bacterium]
MILILHIQNKEKASWLIVNKKVEQQLDFDMQPAEDNILAKLDELKIDLQTVNGLGLVVNDASLTQVKIFTAIINTMGWQFDIPAVGEFYTDKNINDVLPEIIKKIEDSQKFSPLEVKYQHKADITISKKQPKYKMGD